MRYLLAKLRELLIAHPMVTPEPARVRFVGYGAFSKDVEIFAYLRCQDQDTFLAIQEDLLLRIEDLVQEAGSGFAFPSSTTYLARDAGMDAEHGKQAETMVRVARRRSPAVPRLRPGFRNELQDSLDFPPKGSPDFRPPGAAKTSPAAEQEAEHARRHWRLGFGRSKRGPTAADGR